MKVKELIEELQKVDQDKEVVYYYHEDDRELEIETINEYDQAVYLSWP